MRNASLISGGASFGTAPCPHLDLTRPTRLPHAHGAVRQVREVREHRLMAAHIAHPRDAEALLEHVAIGDTRRGPRGRPDRSSRS